MEGITYAGGNIIEMTAAATHAKGDIIQVPDGRAGVIRGDHVSGDLMAVEVTEGLLLTVPKTTSMVMLDGSEVFWDASANKAHLLHGGDADFALGTVYGTAASSATTVKVALNKRCTYKISLASGFASVPVETAGFVDAAGSGEGVNLRFSATAEAQKVDALSHRKVAPSAITYVDALVCVNDNGDDAALDINIGLADDTHATDADSIVESLFCHIDGNNTTIFLESDDNTTEVAATNTTVAYVVGTPFLVQWDLSDLADIQAYINGVNVLPSSVFKLDAAAGPLGVLAHMEKTSNDTLGNVTVLKLGAR